MTLPYLARLLCLILASVFVVHLFAATLVALCTRRAIARARSLTPARAAGLLLTLRLLPALMAAFVAFGLCTPSYLWLEPYDTDESIGFLCLLFAAPGALLCAIALVRAARALSGAFLFARRCRQSGRELPACAGLPVLVVESSTPLLALIGILRPRVVVSQAIADALPADELSAVLHHELAHCTARDNLKRMAIFLSPAFLSAGRELERAWMVFSEYAADARAAGGDPSRSIALASALVRVARFGLSSPGPALAMSVLGPASHLATRVDRLLAAAACPEPSASLPWKTLGLFAAASAAVAAMAIQPATFRFVQSVLERLIN